MHKISSNLKKFIIKRPFLSFILFLVLILVISTIQKQIISAQETREPENNTKDAKAVSTFKVGSDSSLTVLAKVNKENVLDIVSQINGVVAKINVTEGQLVQAGEMLVSLSSSYNSGNASTIQRQIAEATYQNRLNTFELQKKSIADQEKIARQTKINTDELNKITEASITETEELLQANRNVLDRIEDDINDIKDAEVDEATRQALDQQKAQYLAMVNSLEATLRANKYQVNPSNSPAELSRLQKDLALKQLNVQYQALELGLKTSNLQLSLAKVNENLMFPSAPLAGTIAKIYVKPGQNIAPGTPLVALVGSEQTIKLEASVSSQIATLIDSSQASEIYLSDGASLKLKPQHISQEAINKGLHAVTFLVPSSFNKQLSNSDYVTIKMPLQIQTVSAQASLVPLQAIFQTQNKAFVFVVEAGRAQARAIILGKIVGDFVEAISGLNKGEQVILERNVINGQEVKVALTSP